MQKSTLETRKNMIKYSSAYPGCPCKITKDVSRRDRGRLKSN